MLQLFGINTKNLFKCPTCRRITFSSATIATQDNKTQQQKFLSHEHTFVIYAAKIFSPNSMVEIQ